MAEVVAAHKEQAATVRKGPTWLAINWAIAWLIIDEEGITVYNLRAILKTDFMGFVSCVIAFWFGNRTFGKRKT